MIAGPPGAGKTTLGLALADRLRLLVLDLDALAPLKPQANNDPRAARYAKIIRPAHEAAKRGIDCLLIAPFTAELANVELWQRFAASLAPARITLIVLQTPAHVAIVRRAQRGLARDRENSPGARSTTTARIDPLLPAIWADGTLPAAQSAEEIVAQLDRAGPQDSTEQDSTEQDCPGGCPR